MVRPFLNAILILLLMLPGPSALAIDSHCYPLKDVLKMVGASPRRVRAIHYNDLASEVLETPDPDLLLKKFERLLEVQQALLPAFPKEEFLEWYRAHPYSDVELRIVAKHRGPVEIESTVGKLLNTRALRFADTLPDPEIQETLKFNKALKKSLLQFRKKNKKASLKTAWEYLQPKVAKTFPCLVKNPKIALGTGVGYIIGNAGATQGYFAQPAEKRHGYTWEGLINGTIWTPIISELTCKIMRKGQAGRAGELVDDAAFDREFIKDSSRIAGIRMKPERYPPNALSKLGKLWFVATATAPFEDVTYTYFHLKFEQNRQKKCREKGLQDCKEVDSNFKHLANNFKNLLLWDAGPAAVRKIALQNPLYYHVLPNVVEPVLDAKLGQPAGTVVYVALEGGVKYTISSINTYYFLMYQKAFLDGTASKSSTDAKKLGAK